MIRNRIALCLYKGQVYTCNSCILNAIPDFVLGYIHSFLGRIK